MNNNFHINEKIMLMNSLLSKVFEVGENSRCAVRRIGYSIDSIIFRFFIELPIKLKNFLHFEEESICSNLIKLMKIFHQFFHHMCN